MIASWVTFCVRHPWWVVAGTAALSVAGWTAMRDTPVDAFPDVSENQVIVLADWPGQSPQDVLDQVIYPLSTSLQGVAGVRELRSMAAFGIGEIYVVFDDGADPYWARSRVLEKLASTTSLLPRGAKVELGPDATPLGQVLWYVLDGPGRDLGELRTLQDTVVRYALQGVEGVAEVAGVGGFVREYQVDVSPLRLAAAGVTLDDVARAVEEASLDSGVRTIEQNGLELAVRGLGFVRGVADIEALAVAERGGEPIFLRDVARVQAGGAFRRGALADEHGERVGGVVTIRHGAHPQQVIESVKAKMKEIETALPPDIRISPFYDRTTLINETFSTLRDALLQEFITTIFVIMLFLLHVRTSLIVATTLPVAVLMSFLGMRWLGLGADIMSLSGIAIAIGEVVDMGIISAESAYAAVTKKPKDRERALAESIGEVAPAITTAVATTIVSFLPVFLLTGQSAKLFTPLAWTKTFAMLASAILAVTLVPALCRLFLVDGRSHRLHGGLTVVSTAAFAGLGALLGLRLGELDWLPGVRPGALSVVSALVFAALALWAVREPLLLPEENPVHVVLGRVYRRALGWALAHRKIVLWAPGSVALAGVVVLFGLPTLLRPLYAIAEATGRDLSRVRPLVALEEAVPGLGSEFMPPLDEGSFLAMPSLLPQASLSEAVATMQRMNAAIAQVPEVAGVMGKAGRADSALDPAPVAMLETVVNLVPRSQWRAGFTESDILGELERVAATAGTTPSWLQPIETRIVMLQSGIRASLALRLSGSPRRPDGTPHTGLKVHEVLEDTALALERVVRQVPGTAGVTTMRQGGKPYLEIELDRMALARYALSVDSVQRYLRVALGGEPLATTVEGRERPALRVSLARELRDERADVERLLVPTPEGPLVPLSRLAHIHTRLGPASIRVEDGQLTAYVLFNAEGRDEQAVVQEVLHRVDAWRKETTAERGTDPIPAGVALSPAGRWLDKVEADRRLWVIFPIVFLINAVLIYMQFRRWNLTFTVLSAIPVALGGGILLVWAYPDILDVLHALGLRERPSDGPVHITTAVWIGFISLFGIAVDDGVVVGTYIRQLLDAKAPTTPAEVRELMMTAGARRIRAMLMTTLTTLIGLLPILWATGRGSDLMQPMALPAIGGMLVAFASVVVVPCVYASVLERGLAAKRSV